MNRLAIGIAMVLLTAGPAGSQWLKISLPGTPRTPDGKPDLQGVWRVWNLAKFDIEDHAATWGVPAGRGVVEGGVLPYQPAAAEKKKQNFVNSRTSDAVKNADPLAKCYLPGVPRITYLGFPFQILELPNECAPKANFLATIQDVSFSECICTTRRLENLISRDPLLRPRQLEFRQQFVLLCFRERK